MGLPGPDEAGGGEEEGNDGSEEHADQQAGKRLHGPTLAAWYASAIRSSRTRAASVRYSLRSSTGARSSASPTSSLAISFGLFTSPLRMRRATSSTVSPCMSVIVHLRRGSSR